MASELAQKNYFMEKKLSSRSRYLKTKLKLAIPCNNYLHDTINDSFSHIVELVKLTKPSCY